VRRDQFSKSLCHWTLSLEFNADSSRTQSRTELFNFFLTVRTDKQLITS
jgi:hypothetical protein